MPGLFELPTSRRHFLHRTALGGAALFVAGCRSLSPRAPAGAADAAREFHVALFSDTHLPGDRLNGSRGFNPWENLRRVVPEMVQAQPEAALLCGDAARLEGKPEDYRELREQLQPLAEVAPICIALGNHDHRANFWEVFPDGLGSRQKVDGKHVTVIEHAVVRLVVLDSLLYVNQTAGLLGKAQRQWLAAYLPAAQDRPLLVFVHHTLGDNDGELADVERLFELLRPHPQVKAVFFGHSHAWSLTQRQQLHLVNLPAVGYNFSDGEPVGWVDARFRGDGLRLTLHAFAGNRAHDGRTFDLAWL